MDGLLDPPVVVAAIALLVAVYGAWLSTMNFIWQRRRDKERRQSDIKINLIESPASTASS